MHYLKHILKKITVVHHNLIWGKFHRFHQDAQDYLTRDWPGTKSMSAGFYFGCHGNKSFTQRWNREGTFYFFFKSLQMWVIQHCVSPLPPLEEVILPSCTSEIFEYRMLFSAILCHYLHLSLFLEFHWNQYNCLLESFPNHLAWIRNMNCILRKAELVVM